MKTKHTKETEREKNICKPICVRRRDSASRIHKLDIKLCMIFARSHSKDPKLHIQLQTKRDNGASRERERVVLRVNQKKIDNYKTQVVLEYCRCIDMDLVETQFPQSNQFPFFHKY